MSSVSARWEGLEFPEARSLPSRFIVAAGLAVMVWVVVQVGLEPFLPGDQAAYLLAALAVLVSASIAGIWAGTLTTVILALAASYWWAAPVHAFRIQRWQDVVQMALFLVIGISISTLAGRQADARRAARESEERFRRMFEQGPLGIALIGRDHRVLVSNPMLCRMLGYTPEELRGRTFESLTYPPDVAADVAMIEQVWAGRIPGYTLTKRYVRSDGKVFWGALSVAVVRDEDGEPNFALGMVQDVTEQKQLEESLHRAKADAEAAREEAIASSRAKDEFLAVLSHELRTPLSPVLLMASSLEADLSLSDLVRKDVHVIRQNVELEARLIDDLLDLTGIARGKLSLNRKRLDAHALIGEALYMVERDAAEKGVRIHTELRAACAEVDADPTRLQQVFWNLLKNAVKFTPAGGEVALRTACEPHGRTPAEADWFVVEVHDTGQGIAPEVLPRLFKAFEQGPTTVARQFGGLGLGLAIARSIVELHGGRIEANSPGIGHGATFTVRLPLSKTGAVVERIGTAPGGAATRAEDNPPPRQGAGLRILLVEDHPATRRAMSAILTSLGHQVRAAATLAEALALAEAGTFDLVVSDLALPDGSGHDLMRQLKERQHDLHGVAVSGFGMADDVRRSREAGFDEHMTKPISRERLQEALSHIGA